LPSTADQQDEAEAWVFTWAIEKLFTVEVGVGVAEADGLAEALAVVGVTLGLSEADGAGVVATGALEVVLAAVAEQAARGNANASGMAMVVRTRRGFIGGCLSLR
jgi:hypothetical protein